MDLFQTSPARTRVLVIEDNPADRRILKQTLDRVTDPVFSEHAESLQDARRHRGRPWDVLLLDLHLPGSRGIETLHEAQSLFPDTPIIVLTGLSDESTGASAVKAGAQDYLVKSGYNAAILQRTIRHSRERFRLNADLRAERTRLNHILANTSEGIISIREDGSVQFANPAALKILGLSLASLQSRPWPYGFQVEGPHRMEIERAEGGGTTAELRLTRTESPEGSLFLCTLRDVSEEERLQRSLIEREKMAAVGELSSGIAHEFNNLLAAVQANVELVMLRHPESELGRNILTAIDRGKTLVQDLMTFNPHKAPQEGRTQLGSYFTVNQAVISKLVGPQVEVHVHPVPDSWSVPMGSGILNQIVINLAVNARDAMPEGGRVDVSFSVDPPPALKAPPESGGWACIHFKDTGCGMSEDVRRKVFDPFFTTKGRQGNGLGLTAVYNLVRDCGGDIRAESSPGQGSTFHVWLPRYDAAAEAVTSDSTEPSESPDKPLRVLFVEDEELLRLAMSSYLDTRGYDVTSVANGRAALDAIELTNMPFDAVVTDQVMPIMTGTEFLEHALPILPAATFVLTSAHELRNLRSQWPHAGRVHFLPKPYHGHELHEIIRKPHDPSSPADRSDGSPEVPLNPSPPA